MTPDSSESDDRDERPSGRWSESDEQTADGATDDPGSASETPANADAGEPLDVAAMADRLVEELPDSPPRLDREGPLPVPIDRVFELLSAPGNRFVLTYLLRVDDPASYEDLVEYVVERAAAPDDLTDAKYRGRIAARLVHTNLPELAEAGLIRHDADDRSLSSTAAIDAVAPYLALAISQSRSGNGDDEGRTSESESGTDAEAPPGTDRDAEPGDAESGPDP